MVLMLSQGVTDRLRRVLPRQLPLQRRRYRYTCVEPLETRFLLALLSAGSNTPNGGSESLVAQIATSNATTVNITTATNPIVFSNQTATAASGTGEPDGATVSVVASDGTKSTDAKTTTVSKGVWSVTGIDVSSLNDGTIKYSATITDMTGSVVTSVLQSTKDTTEFTSATSPINIANQTATAASGTGVPGATISVVASDGTTATRPKTTTVTLHGIWSIAGIDVSSLNDGTITYTAKRTDNAVSVISVRRSTKDTATAANTVTFQQTEFDILHMFTGGTTDGSAPQARLTLVGSTLYGTTQLGGNSNAGTVFSMKADGSGYTILHSFGGAAADGNKPVPGLTLVGSTLYGTTLLGGSNGIGTVFSINVDGSGFKVLHSFAGGTNDGDFPYASLTSVGSTLYGTTGQGGSTDSGTVFSINTDGSGFTVLHFFTGGDGSLPTAGLTLAGSTLFGTTSEGDQANHGDVFSINTNGSGFTVVHDFDGAEGSAPTAGLTLVGSTLFGTTLVGGTLLDDSNGAGTVFSINTNGSGFHDMHTFNFGDGNGPGGGLTLVGSALFGTTQIGGEGGNGTLFSINTNGSGFAVRYSFKGGSSDGGKPFAALTLVGSTLFGTTQDGDIVDGGTVFTISPDSSAGDTVLHNFGVETNDGNSPFAALTLVGPTLFGTTQTGGNANDGTVFSIHTDGSGYAVLHDFTGGNDGGGPQAGLTLVGSTLFGTTQNGGSANAGTVFSMSTDGSGFTILHEFNGMANDGNQPLAALTLVGSTLYGTTRLGGSNGIGTVFSINIDGSGFNVLHSFAGGNNDGDFPYASLTSVGSTLYGTTGQGGSTDSGTLFSINTDGSGYTVLHFFTGGDGLLPTAGLTTVGSALFGTTSEGGSSNDGTVFSINIVSSGFTVLHDFGGNDGSAPKARLALLGSTLFGTTLLGGSSPFGTVFSINTDGSGFTVLHSFAGGDGDGPEAGLTVDGSTFFGTTQLGGSGTGLGTLFAITVQKFVPVPPPVTLIPFLVQISPPARASAEGALPAFTNVLIAGTGNQVNVVNVGVSGVFGTGDSSSNLPLPIYVPEPSGELLRDVVLVGYESVGPEVDVAELPDHSPEPPERDDLTKFGPSPTIDPEDPFDPEVNSEESARWFWRWTAGGAAAALASSLGVLWATRRRRRAVVGSRLSRRTVMHKDARTDRVKV